MQDENICRTYRTTLRRTRRNTVYQVYLPCLQGTARNKQSAYAKTSKLFSVQRESVVGERTGRMKDTEVIESFDNAWRALARWYSSHPHESTRQALNMLSRIIDEVKSKVEKSKEQKQITIEEWIAMLAEEK